MTWWLIPIVLAAWAFDAVTDPDKRRAIAQGVGKFADWYIAEVGGGLARILLPEQTAELDRQKVEGRRMLAERVDHKLTPEDISAALLNESVEWTPEAEHQGYLASLALLGNRAGVDAADVASAVRESLDGDGACLLRIYEQGFQE